VFDIGGYALFLFAVLAVPVWNVFASWRRRRSRVGLPVTDARVLAARLESAGRMGGYLPVWDVEYGDRGERHRARCLEADGLVVTGWKSRAKDVQAAAQRRVDRYAVGDIIQVRLHPGRPHDVSLARDELDLGGLFFVLGMLGVGAVGMGVLYLLS
jgi:hypothetical protein